MSNVSVMMNTDCTTEGGGVCVCVCVCVCVRVYVLMLLQHDPFVSCHITQTAPTRNP